MRFAYTQTYWPQPVNSENFLRPGQIDVYVPGASGCGEIGASNGAEVRAASIAVDHLDLYRGYKAGERLFDICETDSSGWAEVYFALFDDHGELLEDVIKEPGITSILLLTKAVFHPALGDWRSFIIAQIAELFPVESLLMTRRATLGLPNIELADLGFHRIASSELIVRESMLRHPYDVLNESRAAESLTLPQTDIAVVDQLWRQSSGTWGRQLQDAGSR